MMVGTFARKLLLAASERCPRNRLPCLWTRAFRSQCREFGGTARTPYHEKVVESLAGSAMAIPVKGEHISLLESPRDFYEAIKEGVRNSRERVVMASLYIGTGELESQLLDVIADALADNAALRVTLLFDAMRATRPTHGASDPRFTSSAAMLSCLVSDRGKWKKMKAAEESERLRVALYRTPDLTKALQWLLPARLNEVVGVCHLKAFVFDDHVLMTGANLSSSYFTNRQDRYIWFRDSPLLAQHLCALIETVASYSFTLGDDMSLLPSKLMSSEGSEEFRAKMTSSVQQLLPATPLQLPQVSGGLHEGHQMDWDTYLFPTVQMGPLGIRQDEECTLALLRGLPSGALVQLTSAYFNLTPEYETLLLEVASKNDVDILTASPKANGFYGSAGISGLIPRAYSLLEQSLYERAQQMETSGFSSSPHAPENPGTHGGGLSIYEYERSGWTFHAKGLWCTLPGDACGPSVTLIGSSNFGYRSRDRDLEAQIFLITSNSHLSQQLQTERDRLFSRAVKVNSSHFLAAERSGGYVAAKASKLVRSWL